VSSFYLLRCCVDRVSRNFVPFYRVLSVTQDKRTSKIEYFGLLLLCCVIRISRTFYTVFCVLSITQDKRIHGIANKIQAWNRSNPFATTFAHKKERRRNQTRVFLFYRRKRLKSMDLTTLNADGTEEHKVSTNGSVIATSLSSKEEENLSVARDCGSALHEVSRGKTSPRDENENQSGNKRHESGHLKSTAPIKKRKPIMNPWVSELRVMEPRRRTKPIIGVGKNVSTLVFMGSGELGQVGILKEDLLDDLYPLPERTVVIYNGNFDLWNYSHQTTANVSLVHVDFQALEVLKDALLTIRPAGAYGWFRSTDEERILLINITSFTEKMMLQEENGNNKGCYMGAGTIYVLPTGKKYRVLNDEDNLSIQLKVVRIKATVPV